MVEIVTQPGGGSAEEVQRYVTMPLEIGLAGMPALDHIRSQSLFGISDIKCYFTGSAHPRVSSAGEPQSPRPFRDGAPRRSRTRDLPLRSEEGGPWARVATVRK